MLASTTGLAGRLSLVLCALHAACRVSGVVIDVKGKSTASLAQQGRRAPSKADKGKHSAVEVKGHRTPMFHQDVSGGVAGPDGLILTDTRDVFYSAEITIGGQMFTASVDTGSSDTWIQSQADIPNAQVIVSGQTLQYGIGVITGNIETNEVSFAGSTIPDQYYLRVPPDQNQGTNVMGYIGLGHSTLSAIYYAANQTPEAASLIQNIFLSNPSTPNFMTIQLGRIFDPWDATPGTLTIGEVLPGMEQIHQQPQLPVTVSTTGINQRWISILDDDGITVNGKTISFQPTIVTGDNADPQGRLSVLFDTGYTFPQFPEYIVDAIYGGIPGAKKSFAGLVTTYHMPCNAEINMTMSFGGVVYPIHPLDMSIGIDLRSNNAPHKGLICQATFQPIGLGYTEFDMIAGMAFLRNVYLLTNYGDFIDGDPGNIADPYIQMMGTTDTTTMHSEFLVQRAGLVVKGHHNHSSTPVLPMGTATKESPGSTAKPTSRARSLRQSLDRNVWTLIFLGCGIGFLLS